MDIYDYLVFAGTALAGLASIWLTFKIVKMQRGIRIQMEETRKVKQAKKLQEVLATQERHAKWEPNLELMSQDEIDDVQGLLYDYCCNKHVPYQSSYDVAFEDSLALYHELAKLHRKYNQ
jgi:hypothetical protein